GAVRSGGEGERQSRFCRDGGRTALPLGQPGRGDRQLAVHGGGELGSGGEEMNLATGIQLGPYEIIARLGAGGMGEVWRARDTRLNREVAIKVLPASFANDADRLRRFEQEAHATSSLNHPNILTVHDIGTHEGAPYIV